MYKKPTNAEELKEIMIAWINLKDKKQLINDFRSLYWKIKKNTPYNIEATKIAEDEDFITDFLAMISIDSIVNELNEEEKDTKSN